jgi:dTDP-4-amino-4,6-dideoxygalactose transaminase
VAHTFVATISAVVHCGAKPVLVDVHPDYTMDPDALERAITPRTRAVIPVHLNGRLCDMGRIMSIAEARRLIVIEDAAQAIGARPAGTFGRAGCFSFYPLKMLGAFGDGGAVVTNDPELAEAVRRLRFNGEDRSTGEYHHHGFTALLDNVQAAALDVKLRHLPEWIEHRRRIAELYRRELPSEVALPHFDGRGYDDAFQNYVIRARRRDALREHLERRGVETLVHWPKPIWEHRALNLGAYRLPETEAMCREVLSLPMSAETTPEEVGIVGEAVREFFERKP